MNDQVTIVTGASRGIGRAIAALLLGRGQTVIGLARTPPEGLEGIVFVPVDLGDAHATAEALAGIVAAHDIDNVVNNAGLLRPASVDEQTVADLDAMYAVNVRAAVQCVQFCLPAMRKKRRGRIVNISSRAALGKALRTGYSATKAAQIGLTRTWALELAADGITVNCIAPGPIETELFHDGNPPDSPATAAILKAVPVGRMGRPEEVAAACAFFLSEEAAFVTGQVLHVCGGLSVGVAPI